MKLYHYTMIATAKQLGARAMLRPRNECGMDARFMSWWGSLLWLTDLDAIAQADVTAFGVDPIRLGARYVVDELRVLPWLECPMRDAVKHAASYAHDIANFERGRERMLSHWFVTAGATLGVRDRQYHADFDIDAAQREREKSVALGRRAEGFQDLRKFINEQKLKTKIEVDAATAEGAAK